MPTVPYNPIAGASPSGQGSPYFTDRGATEQAFGAGIGQSMEKFGTQLERTADVVQGHVLRAQADINEAAVNAAVTADIQTSGELNNKFRMLPGNQAQEGLEDHVKNLQKNREDLRDSLKNPMAKKMFDQQTMHRFALDTVNSSQYAATQAKQYLKQSINDNSETIIQDMARDPTNKAVMEKGLRDLIENEKKNGKLDDANPDAINKNIRNRLTQATASISGALAKNDPKKAQEVFDEAKKAGVIDATKVDVIQNTIDERSIQTWALLDGKKIEQDNIQADIATFNRNPEGTLLKMREAASKQAEERYPNDPVNREKYLKQLETNIIGGLNTAKKAQTDYTVELKKTIESTAGQEMPGTGRKPISIAELNALNPKMQDFVDDAIRRDPAFRTRLQNMFQTNNDTDKIIPPEQLAQAKAVWAGMQPSDKMKTDPGQLFKEGKIDIATRKQMYDDQNKIKSQANNIFAADGIMRRHGAALNDAGIFQSRTDTESNTKYMWFRGALESELQRVQTQTGVQVKGPQEDQIVNDLLKQQSTGQKSWFGLGSDVEKPKYEMMSAEQPDWVKKSYRSATKNQQTGKWQVWQDGKLYDINPPKEEK